MKFELTHNTPQWLDLHSTKHYKRIASVFFSVHRGDEYETLVSFTPDEARRFGQMLIDEAESIEKLGFK